MLKIDRQNKILDLLKRNDSVLVTELSDFFNCSDETIRRDLKELEKSNLLTRTHGGAFLTQKNDKTYPTKIRNILLLKEKIRICKKALEIIDNNDFIFLDSSKTCYQLAKFILESGLSVTIATNSFIISQLCTQKKNDINLIVLGGYLRNNNMSTVGVEAVEQINNYFADKCFISPPKVNLEKGIFDNNILESKVREAMITNSNKKIILADNTKFQSITNYKITNTSNFDLLISDIELSTNKNDILKKYNVKFIQA
ncbi:DeoR/GlpR transcriptional regulator [Anaerococcus sp. AGMB00486]|uniref:DeoR/GlpR transcriptional regulator n=1 Tax=Anaerococcus faecalis TaxID=2742993 RepID=A0ABX2N931_9FIRM|nr:DeoR/GlpR family DNA-binding transcription regulator [Anaerococcus faecalis]NVF11201.1 DeoR/GlpR transcriptional regulator [Anaerococcus faecalis]